METVFSDVAIKPKEKKNEITYIYFLFWLKQPIEGHGLAADC